MPDNKLSVGLDTSEIRSELASLRSEVQQLQDMLSNLRAGGGPSGMGASVQAMTGGNGSRASVAASAGRSTASAPMNVYGQTMSIGGQTITAADLATNPGLAAALHASGIMASASAFNPALYAPSFTGPSVLGASSVLGGVGGQRFSAAQAQYAPPNPYAWSSTAGGGTVGPGSAAPTAAIPSVADITRTLYAMPADAGLRTLAMSAGMQNSAGGFGPPTPGSYFSALSTLASAANPGGTIMGPGNAAGVAAFGTFQSQMAAGRAVTQMIPQSAVPTQMMSARDLFMMSRDPSLPDGGRWNDPNNALVRMGVTGRPRGTFEMTPRQATGFEAAYMGASLAGSGYSYAANRIMQGGSGMMERADMMAEGLSDVAGGIGMGLGGPLAGIAAKGITQSVLGPLMRYMYAPEDQRLKAAAAVTPFFGAFYGAGGAGKGNTYVGTLPSLSLMDHGAAATGLGAVAYKLNQRDGIKGTELEGTLEDVSAGWSAVSSGMFAGGGNPFAGGSPGLSVPFSQQSNPLIRGLDNLRRAVANMRFPGTEDAATAVTRRLGEMVGTKGIPEAAKRVAPIYASLPESGGNVADILMQYGAEDTLTYERTITDDLTSPVDAMTLSRTSANIRTGRRLTAMASRRARGSGSGMLTSLNGELLDIASLPGGRDSMEYASVAQQQREAGATAFSQYQASTYGVPLASLNATRQILDVLPYSPVSVMKNTLQTLGVERGELASTRAYLRTRRASGQLSEAEELSLTQTIGSERVAMAQQIGELYEGMENRFPAMSAGAPAFAGRYNSLNLAAMRVSIAGGNTRFFGAATGAQKRMQDDWAQSLGFNEGTMGPHSQTGPINTDPRLIGLLQQIANNTKKGGEGNPSTGGGANGAWQDPWQRTQPGDLGNRQAYQNTN